MSVGVQCGAARVMVRRPPSAPAGAPPARAWLRRSSALGDTFDDGQPEVGAVPRSVGGAVKRSKAVARRLSGKPAPSAAANDASWTVPPRRFTGRPARSGGRRSFATNLEEPRGRAFLSPLDEPVLTKLSRRAGLAKAPCVRLSPCCSGDVQRRCRTTDRCRHGQGRMAPRAGSVRRTSNRLPCHWRRPLRAPTAASGAPRRNRAGCRSPGASRVRAAGRAARAGAWRRVRPRIARAGGPVPADEAQALARPAGG